MNRFWSGQSVAEQLQDHQGLVHVAHAHAPGDRTAAEASSPLVRAISARGRRGSALPAPDPHSEPGQGALVGRCDRAPGGGVHGDRRRQWLIDQPMPAG